MRAPGMTLFRMPIFVWTMLVTSVLVLMGTPVLTSALIMLYIDRNLGGSFFNTALGGNAILWQNVFWFTATGRVHHDPACHGDRVGGAADLQPETALRLQGVHLRDGGIGALGFSVWATTCSRPGRSTCRSSA